MKKHSQILLLLLSICIAGNTYAQTSKADSLENVLLLHKAEDTVKVNLLNKVAGLIYKSDAVKARSYSTQAGELAEKLGFLKGKSESLWRTGASYSETDKSMALDYYQRALVIAEEIQDKTGMVRILNSIGLYYRTNGDLPKAIEVLQKCIKIAEEQNDTLVMAKNWRILASVYDKQNNFGKAIEGNLTALKYYEELGEKELATNCLNTLGVLYQIQGNYTQATEDFQKYLKVKEELKDSSGIEYGLSNIGNIYLAQSDYPKALEYYQKALTIAEKRNSKKMISVCYGNIGTAYQRMNNSQALEYFRKALVISEETGNNNITVHVLIYRGDYYLHEGDLENAMDNYMKAFKIAEENKMSHPASAAMVCIGTIYLKQKNYSKALDYTLKSLAIANELKSLNTQKDNHYQLSEIYAATNDYKKAYIHYKQFKELSDSLFGEENVKKITALEYTYKFEKEKQAIESEQAKKDALQAAEKRQQRIVMLSFIVGFILMFFLAVYIYRSYRIKHQSNVILSNQKRQIEEKNDELLKLNEEVSAQRDAIASINAEIELKNNTLEELNATKDKFFSIIAHDLKNSFNGILGASKLLVSSPGKFNHEETMDYVDMIHTSSQNAYKLLENLLEWSMSQTGRIDYKPQEIELKKIVTENANIWGDQARAKNISIGSDIPGRIIVFADKNMLNTILRNLVTNAIKFTPRGGTITITAALKNNEVEIAVCDTGIGMNESTKNKLFRINEKTSIPGTEQEPGTGLGLILCKEFVEKHDGKIWVESELGKGSEFKFALPLKHNSQNTIV